MDYKHLKTLARQYPTVAAASTEIINLSSILNLPKGTEHFISDIHGEYESFLHVLKNGSGSVRKKIEDEFGNSLSIKEKRALATLIYYPEEKLDMVEKEEESMDDWYKVTLHRLIKVCRRVSSKYTRSKVRKALPKDFAYVIEELLHEKEEVQDKEIYYNEIIRTIIRTKRARACIIAFCNLIQRLVIDHLHILGDVYDRGPGAHIIMDTLMNYHSLDFQWGNHDITWMGAASGHPACIATVVRFSARYGNLDELEDGYGINMIPLAQFATHTYKADPCKQFELQCNQDYCNDADLEKRMHKAIAIIQFKLEGQLIKRNPEFAMEDRLFLDKIDFENQTVLIDGKAYPMLDMYLPTIDPDDPYRLSPEEEFVMERLCAAFIHCEKLQAHVRLLYSNGSLYLKYNSNLMYHGCIPLDENGAFRKVTLNGKEFCGKALYDELESYARKSYYLPEDHPEKAFAQDVMYFIWANPGSPLFGKEKMATFERYFIADQDAHTEQKNPYYELLDDEATIQSYFKEFDLDSNGSHIINGHVPVKIKSGETPIKCGGKLLIIDGGFSRPYRRETGIAGYTLVSNSYGMRLVAHKPFVSTEEAIRSESDMHSETLEVEQFKNRYVIGDTDIGTELKDQIEDLIILLDCYRTGVLKEGK